MFISMICVYIYIHIYSHSYYMVTNIALSFQFFNHHFGEKNQRQLRLSIVGIFAAEYVTGKARRHEC